MNINNLRNKVANEIVDLFDHTNKTPYLNVYDRDALIRDIGLGVNSKIELAEKINQLLGESFEIDKKAFEDGRILKLTAPIDKENEQKNINQLREKMQRIDELTELKNLSAEKIREPASVEDTVQYKFIYVYN